MLRPKTSKTAKPLAIFVASLGFACFSTLTAFAAEEETTPVAEETTPVAEDTTPVAEDTTPAAEETTPPAEVTTTPEVTTADQNPATGAFPSEFLIVGAAALAATGAAIAVNKRK
jgi:hypothetical protein